MSIGVRLIEEERYRQIKDEGYDRAHDEAEKFEELALAAVCYATPNSMRYTVGHYNMGNTPPDGWPWSSVHWKPTPNDRIRELQKAGALIAAEIDRLVDLESSK